MLKSNLHFGSNQVTSPVFFQTFDRFHASMRCPSTAMERQSRFFECVNLMVAEAMERRPRLPAGRGESAPCERARRYILENYDRNISLEELAGIARLPKFTLLRAFSARFGAPPHAFHVSVRVARATRLLAQGVSPAEAAALVGFFDQSRLSFYFKRAWATTPAKFAKAIRSR